MFHTLATNDPIETVVRELKGFRIPLDKLDIRLGYYRRLTRNLNCCAGEIESGYDNSWQVLGKPDRKLTSTAANFQHPAG